MGNVGYCPIGEGTDPLIEAFEQVLRDWAKMEKGYYGPAVPKLCQMLAEIGQNYKTEHLVALAKELKAAKDTNEIWRKEFDAILKLEGK